MYTFWFIFVRKNNDTAEKNGNTAAEKNDLRLF